MSKLWKDRIERVLWTAAQAGIAAAIVILGDIETNEGWWITGIAAGLSFLKNLVSNKIGNPDNASTAPGV